MNILPEWSRNQVSFHFICRCSPVYTHLSRSVTREIDEYMDYLPCKLATFMQNRLCVYDVQRKEVRRVRVSVSFSQGSVHCFLNSKELLCVGSFPDMQSVYILALSDFQIRLTAPLSTYRFAAGILPYHQNCYLFGGLSTIPIKSSEKWLKTRPIWSNLPEMTCQRANFNPSLHHFEVFLVSTLQKEMILEGFHLKNEVFRVIEVDLMGLEAGFSCQYVENDDLVVICEGGKVGKWKINRDFRGKIEVFGHFDGFKPSSPPLIYQNSVYFGSETHGKLLIFDGNRVFPVQNYELIEN